MKILFVTWGDSIHTARWISQVIDQGWDIHLFPVDNGPYNSDLRQLTIHSFYRQRGKHIDASVRHDGIIRYPFKRGGESFRRVLGKIAKNYAEEPARLARIIAKIKPDIVHAMELQHGGYLTEEARRVYSDDFPPWIASNWGSDIYLFGRLKAHADKIRGVMSHCDYYTAECERDMGLAREFGFRGTALPVFPGAGGFDIDAMIGLRQAGATSERKIIVLKGYQNWAGRALAGLRAIELCKDVLQNYEIALYGTSREVEIAAELTSNSIGVPVRIARGERQDVLRLHGSARTSIGLSISDGISTSALEAMIMGSYPVQSSTGCIDEWLRDGEGGSIVSPEDPTAIAAAIRRALTDDELVDRAAEINMRTARARLSLDVIKPRVVEMYEKIKQETGECLQRRILNAR